MFQVKSKTDGRIYTVYGVSVTMFLFWNDNHWEWMDMDRFKPVGETS